MSDRDMPRVCVSGHGPAYLERMTYQHRGFTETEYIGGHEAWRCPVCGAVYAFPKQERLPL